MASGLTWGVRGGIETATSNGDFGAYVGLSRGIDGAARAAVWAAGELIRDPYTGAKKGEVLAHVELLVGLRSPARRATSGGSSSSTRRSCPWTLRLGLTWPVELEIRQDGRTISGFFPYGSGSMAVVADRGKVRKEYFRPRAFRFAVEDPTREINLLVGHDYGKPLASKRGRVVRPRRRGDGAQFHGPSPATRAAADVDARSSSVDSVGARAWRLARIQGPARWHCPECGAPDTRGGQPRRLRAGDCRGGAARNERRDSRRSTRKQVLTCASPPWDRTYPRGLTGGPDCGCKH